jgi:WD40 repeat protein
MEDPLAETRRAQSNRESPFRITVSCLMLVIAIVAGILSAAVAYFRAHRTHDIAISAARAVYTATEPDVKSVMFSDDGTVLAAAGAQGSVQLWHTSTTWAMTSAPASGRVFGKLAISPDCRWMSVADAGRELPTHRQSVLRCFRLNRGIPPLPDMGSIEHRSEIADTRLYSGISLGFSPDGRWIASGGLDTVEIRDRSTLRVAKSMRGGFSLPTLLVYSHDGQSLAVGSAQGAFAVIDLRNGGRKFARAAVEDPTRSASAGRYGHYRSVETLVFCRGDTRLISLGGDNRVKVWDTTTGALLSQTRIGELTGWADRSSVLAVTADEKSIVTGSKTAALRLWDLDTGQLLKQGTIPSIPPNYYLHKLAISRDGRALAAAITDFGQDSRIILWDIGDLFAVP